MKLDLLPLSPLLNPGKRKIDQVSKYQKECAERKRGIEFTFAGLKHDRSRQHARLPADVAAYHHRGAYLRNDGAKPRHQRGEERQPRLAPVTGGDEL